MSGSGPGRVKTEKRGLEIVCQLENILIEATDLSQSVNGFHGRTLPVKVQIRVDPAAFTAAEFSHGLGRFLL